jgi:hypothetical protein
MKPIRVKELITESLSAEKDTSAIMDELKESGADYSFGNGFRDKIIDRIYSASLTVNREVEMVRSMNTVFYRIALTGAAAIIIMLISIFLTEGSLSINSVFGLSDSYNESIVCMLTGN